MSQIAALIVAAGQGRRFGGTLPKVFANLRGRPLVLWALETFCSCQDVDTRLLAVAEEHLELAANLLETAGLAGAVSLVTGGKRRQDTVFAALTHLAASPPELIAIHDGARPLVSPEVIQNSLALAREHGACVTATPVTDTIKLASNDRLVISTPDRSALWHAQTPQTFRWQVLYPCYQRAFAEKWEVTDDASVVERCGYPVVINPSSPTNLKITTPEDLLYAEAIMAAQCPRPCDAPGTTSPRFRVGLGYDAHRLQSGHPLVLGGVTIPHDAGLAGHSDADVLCHAICDALLGAAADGDIGVHFPDTDPQLRGISSLELCRRVAARLAELRLRIANVDATIIAQQPRLAPYIPAMRENMAQALGIALSQVSIKATTTEHLGFEGREEGIAAHAAALLAS